MAHDPTTSDAGQATTIELAPFEDNAENLARSMEALMDGIMGPECFRSWGADTWNPPVNVYETPTRLIVCVELAGVEPNELDVQVEGCILHIRGQRPKPTVPDADEEMRVHLMEIDSGRFHRKIPVPPDVDLATSRANYRSGFVWIILPRRNEPH